MGRARKPAHRWMCCLLVAALGLLTSTVWAENVVHSEGVDPLSASPVQREQAQGRFLKGKELYDAGRFEEALAEFVDSRAIVASPNARLYRARCLRELKRYVEAYTQFGRTMVEALELAKLEVRYARTAESATRERAELHEQLGFVSVTIHKPRAETKLYVNDEEIRPTAWGEPVPASPGNVEIRLTTPGHEDQVKQLSVEAGATGSATFEVGPDPPKAEPVPAPKPVSKQEVRLSSDDSPASLRPYAYIAAGVGAVGVGMFTVMGLKSKSTHDDLEQSCSGGQCAAADADKIDTGKSQQMLANIGLAIGAVGLGTAVTLFLLEPDDSENRPSMALELSPTSMAIRGRM